MNVVAEKYTKSESQGIGFITPTSEMRVLFFFMLASRNESRSRLNIRYIILWNAIFLVFFIAVARWTFRSSLFHTGIRENRWNFYADN